MRLLFLQILFAVPILVFSQTPRGRVQINNGTLVTDNGTLLRGAYVSIDTPWDSLPPKEYITHVKELGINCIHLYAEHPQYQTTGENTAEVDSLVKWTKNDSLYVILTMAGWSSGYGNYDYVTRFWSYYASRYKDETHLIFEICNEPYFCSWPLTDLYDSLTIAMERAAYDTIRLYAPETHVIFMSYPYTNSDYNVVQDIKNLGEGIDWNNASIGAHGYTLSSEENRAFIRTVKDSGYAVIITETPCLRFYDSSPDLYANLAFTRVFEEEFVSYVHFLTPRHMIDKPYLFKSKIEGSEIRWSPDFGTWPANLISINYSSPYTAIMSGFYDEGADVNNYDGLTLWYIPTNAYVAFYNLDFDGGADSILIKCSSEYTNSNIEIHLDSLDGPLKSSCHIPTTGRDNVETFSFPVTEIEGVHKVYLVFKGPASILHSIRFKRSVINSIEPVKSPADQEIHFYPNPANDHIEVNVDEKAIVEIFTMLGQVMMKKQVSPTDYAISVQDLIPGSYVVKIIHNIKIHSAILIIH
jgi:hypothetical protein